MNILFTSAGRRNYLINYFKEILIGKVLAADMQLTAPALADADIAIQVPPIYSPDYIDVLLEITSKYKVTAIISLNDLELPILSKHREQFIERGVRLIVSDLDVIDTAFDKWKTVQFLNKISVKTPLTFIDFEEAKEAVNKGDLTFPLVIKPRWGSASIGIEFPENMEELELAFQLLTLRLKRTILAEASKEDINRAILIQEKLPGKEYGLDIVNDLKGSYYGTFAREKLAMRSGETDKAISIIDDKFEETGRKIGENLKHVGNLDVDAFVKDGEIYILELNPRFGGGYPFTHESGMNTVATMISWLQDETDVNQFNKYKEGLIFSKCDRMIRVGGK